MVEDPAKPQPETPSAAQPEQPAPKAPDTLRPKPKEIGGPSGPEPTRYGDWERNGRVSDF